MIRQVKCSYICTQGQSLTVPGGNVLVSDTGSDIEHDDTALPVDIISISETTKLLLTGGIPDVEFDGTQVLIIVWLVCGEGSFPLFLFKVHS